MITCIYFAMLRKRRNTRFRDIREILAYVKTYREQSEPLEVAFADTTPPDAGKAAEIVGPYREAGVTWWLEGI
jgi:hypothetical protein